MVSPIILLQFVVPTFVVPARGIGRAYAEVIPLTRPLTLPLTRPLTLPLILSLLLDLSLQGVLFDLSLQGVLFDVGLFLQGVFFLDLGLQDSDFGF